MAMKFEVAGEPFYFEFNEDILKMLFNSHPQINKIIRGALCKKFVENLGLFLGRKTTLKEAYELCAKIE